MKKRKVRKYHRAKRNSGMKILSFVGIMIAAVICGYLTARFIVAPLLGYDAEVLKLDFPSKMTSAAEEPEEEEIKINTEQEKSDEYALQFGVFSSRSGAEQLKKELQKKDIQTEIREFDGSYKVLQGSYTKKEDALAALDKLKNRKNIDVFVTVLNKE